LADTTHSATINKAETNRTALTLTQSASSASFVPVFQATPLSSNTSKTNMLANAFFDINTLDATGAGRKEAYRESEIQSIGSNGTLSALGNGLRMPADYSKLTPADPAQNP
jgi:hypothetical protein